MAKLNTTNQMVREFARVLAPRAKIGDHVKWQSLDDTIPPAFGQVVEVSPSGQRVEVEWDDGECHGSYELGGASCVNLVQP
jgi:hypothetical protein